MLLLRERTYIPSITTTYHKIKTNRVMVQEILLIHMLEGHTLNFHFEREKKEKKGPRGY